MDIIETPVSGCYEIIPKVFEDNRGFFVKTFHEEIFRSNGLEMNFAEQYYSKSYKGVLRGLHFQIPPMNHHKLVCCLHGKVLDAVVDLRRGSPTYGKYAVFELCSERSNLIYIPSGLAHGFYTISETALLLYNVSTVYSPQHDSGIRWDSVGIPWPDTQPIISERDQNFVAFSEFDSPFSCKGVGQ